MTAIAAMDPSRVIGLGGKLPWHFSEDLKFFKRTTLGHVVLMGRRTYDSIGRPLPGRENWVLTRGEAIPGVRTLRSPEEICEPSDGRKLFLIGGAMLYRELLPACDELVLTRVRENYAGDVWFPDFSGDFELREILCEYPGLVMERHTRVRGAA